MKLIGDGYDWVASVGEYKFAYRPMLSPELRTRVEILKHLNGSMMFMIESIEPHIVCGINTGDLLEMEEHDLKQTWLIVCGLAGSPESSWFNKWEYLTARNLKEGAELAKKHPLLNKRTCQSCKDWWYDDDGTIAQAYGKDVRRPDYSPVACDTENVTCPVGHWSKQKRLTPMNLRAANHYQRCKATGVFPDDPIVARNAEILNKILK